jgi:hypothetical protein
VVLVGPSGCLLRRRQGRKIDSFDVVVRIKKPITDPALYCDYGTRNDVLYVTLEQNMWEPGDAGPGGVWNQAGVQWVVFARRKRSRRRALKEANVDAWAQYRKIPGTFYRRAVLMCQGLPLAGVITILDLARMPLKRLHLTGFTFYRTEHQGHYKGYQRADVAARWDQETMRKYHNNPGRAGSSHYVPPQIALVCRTIKTNKHITADPVLEGVLNGQ